MFSTKRPARRSCKSSAENAFKRLAWNGGVIMPLPDVPGGTKLVTMIFETGRSSGTWLRNDLFRPPFDAIETLGRGDCHGSELDHALAKHRNTLGIDRHSGGPAEIFVKMRRQSPG